MWQHEFMCVDLAAPHQIFGREESFAGWDPSSCQGVRADCAVLGQSSLQVAARSHIFDDVDVTVAVIYTRRVCQGAVGGETDVLGGRTGAHVVLLACHLGVVDQVLILKILEEITRPT